MVQMVSGVLLTLIYENNISAFNTCIEAILFLPDYGLLRILHLNIASIIFLFLFAHMLRGFHFTRHVTAKIT